MLRLFLGQLPGRIYDMMCRVFLLLMPISTVGLISRLPLQVVY